MLLTLSLVPVVFLCVHMVLKTPSVVIKKQYCCFIWWYPLSSMECDISFHVRFDYPTPHDLSTLKGTQSSPHGHTLGEDFDQSLITCSNQFTCPGDNRALIACGYDDCSFRVFAVDTGKFWKISSFLELYSMVVMLLDVAYIRLLVISIVRVSKSLCISLTSSWFFSKHRIGHPCGTGVTPCGKMLEDLFLYLISCCQLISVARFR